MLMRIIKFQYPKDLKQQENFKKVGKNDHVYREIKGHDNTTSNLSWTCGYFCVSSVSLVILNFYLYKITFQASAFDNLHKHSIFFFVSFLS